mgnify:CR=1 FL=1
MYPLLYQQWNFIFGNQQRQKYYFYSLPETRYLQALDNQNVVLEERWFLPDCQMQALHQKYQILFCALNLAKMITISKNGILFLRCCETCKECCDYGNNVFMNYQNCYHDSSQGCTEALHTTIPPAEQRCVYHIANTQRSFVRVLVWADL